MISAREVTYDVDGLTMIGHLARPEGTGPWPTVLFCHDGIGLTEDQRRRADHLAEHGHLAFAMDYNGGRVLTDPQEMLNRVVPLLADPERMRAIGRAALDVLLAEPGADPGQLAAIGFGGGGTIALELARDGVALRAIAAIHPAAPTPRPLDSAAIRGSVLLGVGSEDPIITPGQLQIFTRAAGRRRRLAPAHLRRGRARLSSPAQQCRRHTRLQPHAPHRDRAARRVLPPDAGPARVA